MDLLHGLGLELFFVFFEEGYCDCVDYRPAFEQVHFKDAVEKLLAKYPTENSHETFHGVRLDVYAFFCDYFQQTGQVLVEQDLEIVVVEIDVFWVDEIVS